MARAEVKFSSWKIFIDGVEVPYIQFSVTTGVDVPGSASIVVEPDPILPTLRPRSMVHIFMYDVSPEEEKDLPTGPARDKDAFKLFWEGEITAIDYSKQPFRSFTIGAEGCMGILGVHKMFMSGVGNKTVSPIITGSSLLSTDTRLLFSLTSSSAAVKFFDGEALIGRYPHKDVPYRYNKSKLVFGDRLSRLVTYISSYSALLRLQVVRSRLLNKIATLEDDSLSALIPRVMNSALFRQVGSNIGTNRSVLETILQYNSYVFHHYVSTTAPFFPKVQPGDDSEEDYDLVSGIQTGTVPVKEDPRSIARHYYRNDYLILPETFYAVPPSCNLVFPEYTRGLNLGRDFMGEPTRAALTDRVFLSNVSVIAPDDLFRGDDTPADPADFWGVSKLIAEADDATLSPYVSSGDKPITLFNAMTDDEIEKGIILHRVEKPMMMFAAVAREYGDLTKDSDGAKLVQKQVKTLNELKQSAKDGKGAGILNSKDDTQSTTKQFIYMLKAIADYDLQLTKLRRSFNIQMEGHRWLVPGLPMTILDTEMSYGCWLRMHTFTVGVNAEESSSIEVDYVRPLPQLSAQNLEDAQNIDKLAADVDRSTAKLAEKYEDAAYVYELAEVAVSSAVGKVLRSEFDEYIKTGKVSKPASGPDLAQRRIEAAKESFDDFIDTFNAVRKETIGAPTTAGKLFLQDNPGAEDDINAAWDGFVQLQTAISARTDALPRTSLPLQDDLIIQYLRDFDANTLDAMKRAVNKFYQYQITQSKTVKEKGPSHMSKLSTLGDKSVAQRQQGLSNSMKAYGAAWTSRTDYPYPPVFANMDLIDMWASEDIYKDLIGAKPVFTQVAKDRNIQKSKLARVDGVEAQQKSYLLMSKYFAVLSKIFPISPDVKGSTEWDSVSSSDDNTAPRKWMDNKFLRRDGLMTLGKFLETNNLRLEIERSEGLVSVEFYRMVPTGAPTKVKSKFLNRELNWDDTIFSKIVDEAKLSPRNVKFDTKGFGEDEKYRDRDSIIEALRETVKDENLTTTARQSIILTYSKRHFGSRAYDGR